MENSFSRPTVDFDYEYDENLSTTTRRTHKKLNVQEANTSSEEKSDKEEKTQENKKERNDNGKTYKSIKAIFSIAISGVIGSAAWEAFKLSTQTIDGYHVDWLKGVKDGTIDPDTSFDYVKLESLLELKTFKNCMVSVNRMRLLIQINLFKPPHLLNHIIHL